MDAKMTYRQLGKPRLVMCEKPKRTEAVHQLANSLFILRDNKFCSRPRKRNSSGQAVKKKMAMDSSRDDLHSPQRGANSMKWIPVPRGMAIAAKTMKAAST